jgi:glycerol uptake facilitator-like aquaporin
MDLARRITADEVLWTGCHAQCYMCLSKYMGDRLAAGNVAIALLANTLATGAAIVALILTFGPISGAHFNPAVTLADAWHGGLAWRDAPHYIAAQTLGAFTGVAVAHLMFGEPLFFASHKVRAGGAHAPGFVVAQLLGAVAATLLFRWLIPAKQQATQKDQACCEEVEALQNALATVLQLDSDSRVRHEGKGSPLNQRNDGDPMKAGR